MTPRRPHHEVAGIAGFTLIEMLVVLTILALVAGLVLPRLAAPSEGLRLESAAREVVWALRLTRSAAIARNADMALEIDVDKRTLQSPAVPLRRFASEVAVHLKAAAEERASASRAAVRFFADGSSTGGELVLALDGQETKICVNWLTGEARRGPDC